MAIGGVSISVDGTEV